MRRLRLALACLLLAISPAAAQNLADQAECLRQALAGYLQYPVTFAGALDDQGNGFYTQHDVQLQTSGPDVAPGKIHSLDVYAFDCAGYRATGVPGVVRIRANGVSVSPASHPLASLLPGLGRDSNFDVTLDLATDAVTRRLTVRQADLEFPGILTLTLAGELSGLNLAGARFTTSGLAGLGLAAALAGSLHALDATLWNESGDRLLDAFARGQGRTLAEQRALWLTQLDQLMASEGPATLPALRELKSFVENPRKLRVRAMPPDGQTQLATLLAAAGLADQIRLLGLTVEADR